VTPEELAAALTSWGASPGSRGQLQALHAEVAALLLEQQATITSLGVINEALNAQWLDGLARIDRLTARTNVLDLWLTAATDALEAERKLTDDVFNVLTHMVVGWEDKIGYDLAKHPEVVRVAVAYGAARSSTPTPTTCATCNGEGVIFDLICDNCGGSASLPFGMTCPNHLAKPTPCPTCAANELTAEAQRLGLYEGDAT